MFYKFIRNLLWEISSMFRTWTSQLLGRSFLSIRSYMKRAFNISSFSPDVIRAVQSRVSNVHLGKFSVYVRSVTGSDALPACLSRRYTSRMYVAKSARSDWNAPTRNNILSYPASRAKHNFPQLENYLYACKRYTYIIIILKIMRK